MIRSIGPVLGTALLSLTPDRSLAKFTNAASELMLPAASAWPWSASRHQAGFLAVRGTLSGLCRSGIGSCVRNAVSKKAGGLVAEPAPPGVVAVAEAPGSR